MKSMLPGMRIIKSVVSVFIVLVIAHILNYSTPFYACIACVIVMKSNPDASLVFGKGRMIGTLLGGCIGGIFILITGFLSLDASSLLYILLISLALLVDFMIAKGLKIGEYATSMSAILVLSVLITHNSDVATMLRYMISRTVETMIGIIVAILVNRYLSLATLEKHQE